MPTNCCVPLWTKKDKRDKETGEKNYFFRFPEEENLKKQWIHAIRRDVGPKFSINQGTRVCSKHFRGEDLQRSLSGKVSPRTGAVPSKFAWKRSSPRKQAPPTPRFTATTVAKRKVSEANEALDSSTECSEIISEDATSTNMADLAFPQTVEMENITRERECGTDVVKKSEKDSLIAEQRTKLPQLSRIMKNWIKWFQNLKRKLWILSGNMRNVRSGCFPLKTSPQMTHC